MSNKAFLFIDYICCESSSMIVPQPVLGSWCHAIFSCPVDAEKVKHCDTAVLCTDYACKFDSLQSCSALCGRRPGMLMCTQCHFCYGFLWCACCAVWLLICSKGQALLVNSNTYYACNFDSFTALQCTAWQANKCAVVHTLSWLSQYSWSADCRAADDAGGGITNQQHQPV